MSTQNNILESSGAEDSLNDKEKLPIFKLLAFALAGFITIMTETIPAGLLSLISSDLIVSEAYAGQLISVYALGSVIAAIPVVASTRSWSRKPLFLFAIAGLLIFNTITALSTSYTVILVARLIAGMAAGIIWGLLAGYARNIVSPNLQGKALAIVGVGQPIALCMGVPLGTWLGSLFGWRGVFWIISALAVLLLVWVHTTIPNILGQKVEKRPSVKDVFLHPGIRSVLAVIFLWIFAHNILYTFISPYLTYVGLGAKLDLILLLFGFSSIFGIWVIGAFIDSSLRVLTIISLFGFALSAILIGIDITQTWLVLAGIILWGVSFGGAPTLLQTAMADTAGSEADIAQAMLVTIFNLAVASGGVFGGVLLQKMGPSSFTITMSILSIIAIFIVFKNRKHGFKIGSRA